MSCLKRKIAVVTGAASGIGKSISLVLASHGAVVYAVDKLPSGVGYTKEDLSNMGRRFIPLRINLEKDKEIRELGHILNRRSSGIDILVHSAAIISIGEIASLNLRKIDAQYRVNVRAPYFLTSLLLPRLIARQGQVVFINSSAGLRSKAGIAAYAASKHALRAIADALREEVNRSGVRVMSIYPGRTATPMQSELSRVEGVPYVPEKLLQPEDIAKVVFDVISLDRSAEITDIHVRSARKWD
jgi:NAD(P)-dependent dehydrogenase (short-subunit alcohol dehydrogenase family)